MDPQKEKELQELMRVWKPYILQVEELIQAAQFGELTFVVKIHQGFVTDLVPVMKQRFKYQVPDRTRVDG